MAQLNSSGKLVSDQIPNIDEITQDAIDAALVAGTGLDKTYNDGANTITLDIDSTVATKTYADDAVSTHNSDTTSVHGITDTAELATKTFAAELLTNATKTNITITGDKTGLIITAENGVADSTTDNLAEGSTNKYFTDERAQDAVGNSVGTGLSYNDSTGAISVTANTYDAFGAAGTAEDNANSYTDTAVAGILDGSTFSGAVAITDATESTSTTSGSLKTAGGLGVVKDAYIGGDLTISGDFTVNGTTTTVSTQDLVVQDPLIYIGENNTANSVDLGLIASFDNGTYQHTGLVRDASDGAWKLFKGVIDEPTTTVNFAQGSLDDLKVAGLTASSITVGDVSNTEFGYLNGVTSAIQTQIDGKQAVVSGVSDTEIGYLDGVTSAIQTQIDGKSPTAGNTSLVTLGTVTTGTWSANTIAINKGGTGATTATDAANALLPSQTSNSGKYLTTDGAGTLSWGTVSGYSAPTLGSTSIASGSTVTTIVGLTKLRSAAFTSLDANSYEQDLQLMQVMGAL